MPALRTLFLVVLALAAGCRRDAVRLDDAQRIAYTVKPAVVRVSAYATAEFHYPPGAIDRLNGRLAADGYETADRRDVQSAAGSVETGAGGSGSGFIIDPNGLILTSAHVVAPTRERAALERELERNGAIAALVQSFPIETLRAVYRDQALDRYVEPLATVGTLQNVRTVTHVELSNGETLPYAIRRYSPPLHERGSDLAVLQIERRALPSVPLGDSEAVRVGDSVWAVGYPAVASSTDEVIGGWLSRETDLEATFNPGTITAIRRNVTNVPVFQSNVAIYRGNSGGPVVNRRGEAIGISTWGHANAEQIKFLVPAGVAARFLAEAEIRPSPEGEFDRHYRAALGAASNGEWVEARAALLRASKLFPNSPDLIRFGADVERAVGATPAWRLHPAAISVLAAALVVTAAGFALSYFRSPVRRFQFAAAGAGGSETVIEPNGPSSSAGADLGKLTILSGPRAGERFRLAGSGIRIGRDAMVCEIVLDNPKVSRLHAEVVSIDGRVLLIDRNSSNGTYVNDEKTERRYLDDGDIIHFGGRNAVAAAFHA